MISIDKRLSAEEVNLLKSIVGKNLISIQHDAFDFTNSSSQVVQVNIENNTFYFYNFTEPLDYFGTTEDVAILSFSNDKNAVVDNKNFINTPVNDVIKKIYIIQEHQQLYKSQRQIYDVQVTRGVIFDFGNYQYAFEKDIWLSEEIYIFKGYNTIEKFTPTEDFKNSDWSEGLMAECDRKILTL